MRHRPLFLLAFVPAILQAPMAFAGSVAQGPAVPIEYSSKDDDFHADVANEGFRTLFWTLGKGYPLAAGLRMTPYLEMGSKTEDIRAPAIFDPSVRAPAARVLVGGVTRYSLASLWTLSFDLAAGLPLLSEQADRPRLAALSGEDREPVWRAGVKLGYAVGSGLRAFTVVEIGSLGAPPAPAGSLRPPPDAAEASLRLGFSYKF